jgi:hypothetical protein
MDRSSRPEPPPWWGFAQLGLVASCLIIVGLALLRSDAQLQRSDWPSFMVAGRLVASQPERLFDRDAEHREQRAVLGGGEYDFAGYGGLLPVVAPPWVALYAAPFAGLGLGAGGRLWILVQFLALTAGLLLLTGWRKWVRALAAMAGVPLLLLVGNAQLDGVLVLGLGLSWHLLRSGREGWAGAALGLALVKPHLALGVAAGLLVAQRWRVLFGWALAAGVLVTACLLLAPGALPAWPGAALFTAGHNGSDLSLPGLLYAVGLPPAGALLAGAAAALAATLAVAARCPTPAAAAAALVLGGLLAAPHLLATDLVVCCFALVLAGLDAVGPLLLLSVASMLLAVRLPAVQAGLGGCLLLGGLLVGAAWLPGRAWTPGIIGRQFGSR